jgi:hypothetical protein
MRFRLQREMIIIGAWLSLVERSVRDREVVGSNPIAPTFRINLVESISYGFHPEAIFFG